MKIKNSCSKILLKKNGVLCLVGILILSISDLRAASFTWDPTLTGNAPVGGTGTWSTAIANWSDGAVDSVWVNGSAGTTNDAVINASSTITLGSAVTVRNITNTGTTTISGGTLTLDSATATTGSAGGPILTGGTSLTISSVIAGTKGLAVNGGVTLSGANTYTGITLVTSGTLKLGAVNTLPSTTQLATFGAGRTVDLNGFSQQVTSVSGSNGIIRSTAAATLTLNGTSTTASGQQLTGALTLVKQGIYIQTFSASQGALNYTGSTTISDGGIRLSTANAGLTGTSSVTVNGGALSSVVAGNLALGVGDVSMSSGSITPGEASAASSFTLALNRNFTTTGGTLNMDFGTTFDQIIGSGTGTFSLTNTTLALNPITGFNYASTYNLFSGFAGGATSGLTITGYDTTNYIASLSNAGVLSFAAVPEPSTYALVGMGLVSLWALRRRRK